MCSAIPGKLQDHSGAWLTLVSPTVLARKSASVDSHQAGTGRDNARMAAPDWSTTSNITAVARAVSTAVVAEDVGAGASCGSY